MSSVHPVNASTVATRNPLAAVNLTLTRTCEQRLANRSKTCFGKKERHPQGDIKCTFTTTRSTKSDAARTPPSSRSSSTKVATHENTTVNSRWATPSCWLQNSTFHPPKSEPLVEQPWRRNSALPAWMFRRPQRPFRKLRKPVKRRWRLLKQSASLRLKRPESKRCLRLKRQLNAPCPNFKHVWSEKAPSRQMCRSL